MFITPIERAVFSIGSMLVGVPLITGLVKIGIFTGPEQEYSAETEDMALKNHDSLPDTNTPVSQE
jgi:hypothetical protein